MDVRNLAKRGASRNQLGETLVANLLACSRPVTVRSLAGEVSEYLAGVAERRPLSRIIAHVGRAADIASSLGDLEACAPTPGSRPFALEVVLALAELDRLDEVVSDYEIGFESAEPLT